MRVIIHSEDDLVDVTRNLLHISINLIHWTKEWEKYHGKILNDRKKYWQNRMEEYLEELGARKTQLLTEVKIEINNENKNMEIK